MADKTEMVEIILNVEQKYNVFDDCYSRVQKLVEGQKVSTATVINLLTTAMEVVEQVPRLSGPDKKELVVRIVNKLVDEAEIPDEDQEAIKALVTKTLPFVIDIVIAAAKGDYDFNKIAKNVGNCWRTMFPCCFPQKK